MVREANPIVMLMCLFSPAVPAGRPITVVPLKQRAGQRVGHSRTAGRPVRGGIEQRVDHRGAQRRPRAVPDHVREPIVREANCNAYVSLRSGRAGRKAHDADSEWAAVPVHQQQTTVRVAALRVTTLLVGGMAQAIATTMTN